MQPKNKAKHCQCLEGCCTTEIAGFTHELVQLHRDGLEPNDSEKHGGGKSGSQPRRTIAQLSKRLLRDHVLPVVFPALLEEFEIQDGQRNLQLCFQTPNSHQSWKHPASQWPVLLTHNLPIRTVVVDQYQERRTGTSPRPSGFLGYTVS